LLNLSNYKISLGKSSYYARFVLLIYILALVLEFYSAIFFPLKMLLALLLLAQGLRIVKNPRPYPKYLMLTYNAKNWLLHELSEKTINYDSLRIVIDAGLFFLLELSRAQKRKYLVVFSDQNDRECYRLLNIIEKIKIAQ
jgi:hypothetical protein